LWTVPPELVIGDQAHERTAGFKRPSWRRAGPRASSANAAAGRGASALSASEPFTYARECYVG